MKILFKKILAVSLVSTVVSCSYNKGRHINGNLFNKEADKTINKKVEANFACEKDKSQENNKPIALVVSAPSGCGKDTAINSLVEKNKDIVKIINVTTRSIRSNEKNDYDYHFVTQAEFYQLDQQGKLFEKAVVYGDKRGILKSEVEDALKNGKNILFNVSTEGFDEIKKLAKDFRVIGIYILPQSKEVLEKRLNTRGTENKEVIEYRMSLVDDAMKGFENYDYKIISDTKEETLSQIESIYKAERIKRNNKNLSEHGKNILKK